MFAQYNRLGVHVMASNIDVIRAAQHKLKRKYWYDRSVREDRHKFYRQMIFQHGRARIFAQQVWEGSI